MSEEMAPIENNQNKISKFPTKYVLIAAIVVVAIVIVGALSFTGLLTGSSARDIIESAIQKQQLLQRYTIDYSIDLLGKTDQPGGEVKISGDTLFVKNLDSSKMSSKMSMTLSGETVEFQNEEYRTPEGNVLCFEIAGQKSCQNVPADSVGLTSQSPEEQIKQLQELIQSGVINEMQYNGQKVIMQRNCDDVTVTFDAAKLLASTNLTNSGNLQNMPLEMCFDKETGLPLMTSVTTQGEQLGIKMTIVMTLTAKSLSLGAEEISLPEVTNAPSLFDFNSTS